MSRWHHRGMAFKIPFNLFARSALFQEIWSSLSIAIVFCETHNCWYDFSFCRRSALMTPNAKTARHFRRMRAIFFLRGECGKFFLLSPLLQLAISFYVWILSNVLTLGTKSLSAFVAAFVMQIATSWLLFIMARNPNMRYLVLVSIDEQIEFSLSLSSQSWFGCSRFYGSFICAENLFCVCQCFYVVV